MRVLFLTACLVAVHCEANSRSPRDVSDLLYESPANQARPKMTSRVELDNGYNYPKPDIQTRPIFKDPEPTTDEPINLLIQTKPAFNNNDINPLQAPTNEYSASNFIQTRPTYNQPENNLVQTRPAVYQQQEYFIQTRPNYNPPQQNVIQTRPIYTQPQQNFIRTRPIYNPPEVNVIQTRPIYQQPSKPNYNPPQNNYIQTRPIYNTPQQNFVRPAYNPLQVNPKPNPINQAVDVVASISNEASEKILWPLFNAIAGGFPNNNNNNNPQYPGSNTIGFPGGNVNYPGNYPGNFPGNYPNYPNYPNNPILNKFPFLSGLFPNNNNRYNYNYQRYSTPPTVIPIPASNGGNFGQVDIRVHGVNSLGDSVNVNEIPGPEVSGYDYPNPNDQQLPHELPGGLQFRTLTK